MIRILFFCALCHYYFISISLNAQRNAVITLFFQKIPNFLIITDCDLFSFETVYSCPIYTKKDCHARAFRSLCNNLFEFICIFFYQILLIQVISFKSFHALQALQEIPFWKEPPFPHQLTQYPKSPVLPSVPPVGESLSVLVS